MHIVIAQKAGFCMGVRRAVDMVLDAAHTQPGPIRTFGPIIHNPHVLQLLHEQGITPLEEIPEQGSGTILIRAHGAPPETKRRLAEAGFRVLDATCPRVAKVQGIITKHAAAGDEVVIIGDANHPEVVGLQGHAGAQGHVVSSLEGLQALPEFSRAAVVQQTTQNTGLVRDCEAWIRSRHPHYTFYWTICHSTENRQQEALDLAKQVDAMVVVGGRESGNSRRLAEVSRKGGKPVYFVEGASDLHEADLEGCGRIGLTAGASTPNWIIKSVYRKLRSLPSGKGSALREGALGLQRLLLLTNMWVALGAACLSIGCGLLLKAPSLLIPALIAFFYVQSMHTVNHLTGGRADKYNDPERERFYSRHRKSLLLISGLTGLTGIALSIAFGLLPFIVVAGMTVLGGAYNVRILPGLAKKRRLATMKDIPGSKTLLITLSWGLLAGVLPLLGSPAALKPQAGLTFLLASALVFVRTAFFDVLDMQGDRIMGHETVALLLGEARTLRILRHILGAVFLGLLAALLLQALPAFGLLLLVCPVLLYAALRAYERRVVVPDIWLEFLVETNFVLIGGLALLAPLLQGA